MKTMRWKRNAREKKKNRRMIAFFMMWSVQISITAAGNPRQELKIDLFFFLLLLTLRSQCEENILVYTWFQLNNIYMDYIDDMVSM